MPSPCSHVDDWTASLDALEEWVRGLDATDGRPLAAAPDLPFGPVPDELVVRARVLQSAMTHAEVALRAVRQDLDRQQAYASSSAPPSAHPYAAA